MPLPASSQDAPNKAGLFPITDTVARCDPLSEMCRAQRLELWSSESLFAEPGMEAGGIVTAP